MSRRMPRENRDKLPGGSGESHSQEEPADGTIVLMPSSQANGPPVGQATRFGERLISEGLINEAQLQRALDAQRLTGYQLGSVVLSLGILDEYTLTASLATHLEMPVADLRIEPVDPDVARLVPEEFARRHVLLPMRRDNGHLAVAMADPGNLALLNDVRLRTGLQGAPCLVLRSDTPS